MPSITCPSNQTLTKALVCASVHVHVYQRPAQVDNINLPVHVPLAAHQETMVQTNNKILPHVIVSVYLASVPTLSFFHQISKCYCQCDPN